MWYLYLVGSRLPASYYCFAHIESARLAAVLPKSTTSYG